jgi:hypothetical protein
MDKHLISLAVALCCGVTGAAFAASGMSKDQYKAEKHRIEAQYKNDRNSCDGMKGNAKDICKAQAKGNEKIAKAELQAQYKPSPKADEKVKDAQADANYRVAREKCDDLKGNDRKVCDKQAKAMRVGAKDQAKADRVAGQKGTESVAAFRERTNARHGEADANYALAKARCDALKGDAKDKCMADAKRTFNKS